MSRGRAHTELLEIERDIARAEALIQGRVSLGDYVRAVSPSYEIPDWTRRAIFPLFERARFAPIRACVSAPPRHGKTYPTLHAIAHWLEDFPADTSAYATYNAHKGRSKSKLIRQFTAKSGVELSPAMANLTEWRTTHGGGLLAGGLAGGGLTGEGVQGILVVDDPFPTAKHAESAVYREEIWANFNSVVMTRLEGASVIVIQTRWHEDDLVGRLEKLGGWEIVNLPARAEPGDPLGRKPGEPLDPVRYPNAKADSPSALGALDDIERQLGPYVWSALYGGQPRSKGHKVFGPPHYYDPDRFDITGKRVVIGADPAASVSTSSDYSAAVVLALEGRPGDPDARAYILEVYREQVQVPDFVNVLHQLQQRYWGAQVVVEAVAGFKGVAQSLQRLEPRLRVIEMQPRENKYLRAQPVAAAWNAGQALMPPTSSWGPAFFLELDRFTGVADAHDDQVDALAHAWNVFAYAPDVPRGSVAAP